MAAVTLTAASIPERVVMAPIIVSTGCMTAAKAVNDAVQPGVQGVCLNNKSGRIPAARLGSVLIVWAVTLIYLFTLLPVLREDMRRQDFGIYFAAARSLRLGRNPYTESFKDLEHSLGLHLGGIYTADHTPTFLLCFEPLTKLSLPSAYLIWIGLTVACFAGGLYLLLGPHSGLPATTALILAAFAILYPPVTSHFEFAQSQILVMFILVLMMRLMESGYEAGAGVLLSLAGLLRAYPLLLVVYLLIKRRWRAVAFTVGGVVVGGAFTALMLGPARTFSFLAAVGLIGSPNSLSGGMSIGFQRARVGNASVQSSVAMLFMTLGSNWSNSLARSVTSWLVQVALLAATIMATKAHAADEHQEWREFCLWIVARVMLSPLSWTHYQVLLLIPYIQLTIGCNRGGTSYGTIGMEIASYCLTVLFVAVSMVVAVLANGDHIVGRRWWPWLVLIQSLVLLTAYLGAYRATREAG